MTKKLHPIMLAGTGSDVGKSVLATALCRIFLQDGYTPAPFKAQNMALNSYATPDGFEIGRAQAVQAEAAGVPCHTDMNPLLLKPQSDHTSQVVLHGRPIGNRDAYDLWRNPTSPTTSASPTPPLDFRHEVCAAFDRLSSRYNPIVMEGAGSISELNLRHRDLVNMPMAQHAKAKVVLVADIDRGGVFASAYGSIALQTEEDRRIICGIIVNKFRGDLRLFDEGRRILEDICRVPVLGVVPFFKDISIEGEDSVAIDQRMRSQQTDAGDAKKVNIAVVKLPHLSNYTDFDAIEHDARVHLYYTIAAEGLKKADIIILPGTKSTISDLQWLRQGPLAEEILRQHREGKTVVGICGGYQMMGCEVLDPDHVEGTAERMPGLGLLPVSTTMSGQKITRQTRFRLAGSDGEELTMSGYEIHMGTTHPVNGAPPKPFAVLNDGRQDGYVASARCFGTYLHGALDNAAVAQLLLAPFADRVGQRPQHFDYQAFKQQQYDRLADHVRRHIDMDRLYQILSTDD